MSAPLVLTTLAMVAFAANSLLCRLALAEGSIDAASFTTLRIASGALVLWLLVRGRSGDRAAHRDWSAAAALFAYAVGFSFAYNSLAAGTGALILFGAVQLTMFGAGLAAGERLPLPAWGGLLVALAGLVYLVSPGVTAPDPLGAALMGAAGVAWGVYSLRGRGVADPLQASAGNFLLAVPPALLTSLLFADEWQVSAPGVLLAIASGALASALGYVIWYAALRGLSATRAATVQLSVPALAAFGGVLFLGEALTPRLLLATAAVLGGIALALAWRGRPRPARAS